jgi:hypothetical protein
MVEIFAILLVHNILIDIIKLIPIYTIIKSIIRELKREGNGKRK